MTQIAGLVAREAGGGNATGQAIAAQLVSADHGEIREVMSFSSARKMSAIRVAAGRTVKTYFLGAPEYVAELAPVKQSVQRQLDEWASSGRRVLLLVEVRDEKTPLKQLAKGTKDGVLLGAVVLVNPLREGVEKTVTFLQNKGVSIRVISGDNPQTVQYIAHQAGITGAEKSITGKELAALSQADFERALDENTIFARVLPEQKERLVEYFQSKGLFTGMVGDGVNDALALKKADLGVAMHAGATVSRRVADVILLNNSFTALPMGMKLGSRIIQAIEIIATLFFHKIIYGVVLLLGTLVLGMAYPFMPRHITFMNMFLVSLPTIMWTVFPPMSPHRANPRNFWQDTLQAVAPIAIITGLTVTFTYWVLSLVYPDRSVQVATMTVLTATFFGVYLVFLTARMLGVTFNKTAKKARLLY
ncbi:cation-transporting ATPase, partial [Candidatus Saccharibacteria bacterium 32-49-10]